MTPILSGSLRKIALYFLCTMLVGTMLVGTTIRAAAAAEPVPLKRMVDLALAHATGTAIALADEQHASAGYRELRNSFIPQLNAGSGLGWSDGFPLSLEGSAPSLVNVNAQSALLNPALKDFIRAARADVNSSTLHTKEQRNQVIQDTVLSYAELAKWERRLSNLHETQSAAEENETAVTQRVKEGVDSELNLDQARLSVARVRLRFAEAEGSAAVLRERLSHLTGLPNDAIEIDPDSIPTLPATEPDEDSMHKATQNNPSVESAVEHARAQFLRVKAERKSLWPSADFAAQYALLSTFNNYESYYTHVQPNNATVGIAIHLPFLNLAQHAKVQEAEADAFKATKQAEAARNQVSEETLRLQRSVTQFQAARDVASLEYEIAQKNVGAVRTRMEGSTANLHDLDTARSQASERFIALEDVKFGLEQAQVELLRSTGGLESWAMGTK